MSAHRPGWIIRSVVQVLLLGYVLALIWGAIWLQLRQEHIATERDAIKEARNLALAFEENIVRSISAIDQVLLFIRDSYARDPSRFDLSSWTRDRPFINDQTFQLSLIDATGMLVQSNLGQVPVDLSDREHFRIHVNAAQDRLFISRPVLGRVSGRHSVQFTRRITGREGEFLGVVVASLDPHYLARFYESLQLGDGFLMLVGLDGYVRAGRPLPELVGKPLTNSPLLERAAQSSSGDYQVSAAAMTGRPSFISYRRLVDYPLVVSVGYDTNDVFALYRLHRLQYIIGGIALSALVVAVGMLMASHRRRLARYQGALTVTLENMRQGIIMVDRDQQVAVINRRVGELLGLPAALLHEGMDFGTIVRWQVEHGEFAPDLPTGVEIDAVHDRYGLGNKVSVYERVRPNGTVLEVRTALLPNGGAVRTYTDITERKHNEHDLAAARDAAEAAGQARAQFLTVMSHEIRTPLNGIIGAAALLLDRRLDPEDQHYVEIIRHSGDHLLQLVNDILDFSRLDASCMELEEVEFDLRATFTGSVEMCATSARAKGLALTLRVAEDVPARAIGDPGRLRQVLLNLVGNAVKFTEQGSIDMAVSCAACETDVVRIEVAVRDTGIGIPAEALPRLFHEFSQVDGSISRRFGGSGLGLVISRRLVERMGGLLSVESTPGQGSTFHFGVALRPAPILFVEEQAVWLTRQPARRLHILLVEDNATNRLIASRMLERMGHRVDAVADGSEAVETVQTMPYDLVLMDVMMPEMDGLTATRLIRDLPGHTSRTPIVGLTANAERSREAACREAGMDGFVSKPVTAERLAEAIDDVTTTCRGEAKADCCPQLNEAVLSRLADDIGFANALDVVQLFLEEAPRMMNRLELAIRVEDRALLREVHTLASAARSVGLLRVGQTAADVESLLSAGRPTAPLLAALPDILAEDVSLLADWMSHQHATA